MAEKRTWTKAKTWTGKDLKGTWHVTYKADGVRGFYTKEKGWFSRNDKPLYNMPPFYGDFCPAEGYEVYCMVPGNTSKANYKETITRVRAKTKDRPVSGMDLYSLNPLDSRLNFGQAENPTAEEITVWMQHAVGKGWEGLILRGPDGKWLKVKTHETFDVLVTKVIPGKGKHTGRMGALMTEKGKVGTGFTDEEREEVWTEGDMIEVSCMQLTADGKFRHPAFERRRYDK